MNIPKRRRNILRKIEEETRYVFQNIEYLNLAFVHSSYGNEVKSFHNLSNERLEFLGDAVLELIVSDYLYKKLKDLPEGDLTRIRSQLVCEKSFAEWARTLNFGDYLLMGRGEEKSGGRTRDSVLADTLEAFCGAIYLDSNFKTAKEVVTKKFLNPIDLSEEEFGYDFDYKTKLQEFCQKTSQDRVHYFLIDEKGPDHNKTFTMGVQHGGKKLGQGTGKSKKEAEQNAAKNAFNKLGL